jgi:glutamyl-tRNA synthetase
VVNQFSGSTYRGRLAPSPTGYLHLGHARTFWIAQERARAAGGTLVLRDEDLDSARCRPEFAAAMIEDLRWFGFRWQEGPDCGGALGSYRQSERRPFYTEAFCRLLESGFIYPCTCSRKDVQRAVQAPHHGEDEPIYPGTCRPPAPAVRAADSDFTSPSADRESDFTHHAIRIANYRLPTTDDASRLPNWRFRVPDGEVLAFLDGCCGPQTFVAGRDFGDFIIWRHDDVPAYQLAVVADDAAMRITEVVRGEDLLISTARQLLLYRALGLSAPAFYHCPLVRDEAGHRLAKRHDALSLRKLRESGCPPESLRIGLG